MRRLTTLGTISSILFLAVRLVAETGSAAGSGLTARQMFYRRPAAAPTTTQAEPAVSAAREKTKTVRKTPAPPPVSGAGQAKQPASGSQLAESSRLGLRYTILGKDRATEVNPEKTFHTGEH